jgi:hypothetical protein
MSSAQPTPIRPPERPLLPTTPAPQGKLTTPDGRTHVVTQIHSGEHSSLALNAARIFAVIFFPITLLLLIFSATREKVVSLFSHKATAHVAAEPQEPMKVYKEKLYTTFSEEDSLVSFTYTLPPHRTPVTDFSRGVQELIAVAHADSERALKMKISGIGDIGPLLGKLSSANLALLGRGLMPHADLEKLEIYQALKRVCSEGSDEKIYNFFQFSDQGTLNTTLSALTNNFSIPSFGMSPFTGGGVVDEKRTNQSSIDLETKTYSGIIYFSFNPAIQKLYPQLTEKFDLRCDLTFNIETGIGTVTYTRIASE